MGRIKLLGLEPLKSPKFVKPFLIRYEIDEKEGFWEAAKVHDSVAVLIYHRQKEAFVLVKQFRPPLFVNHSLEFCYELCAGILDKNKTERETAAEEILEETGYAVDSATLRQIASFYTSVGFAGSKQSLFYAEVSEDMRVSQGGGVEEERIEVVYLPIGEAERFLREDSVPKTPGLMYALCWWFSKNS